jgi:NAD(P)-dependent dehydrogenase (short-subunit alcohol dehydrogenase family)
MTRTDKSLLLAAAGFGLWWLSRRSTQEDYSLANKTVFITGGSRGLGLVLARELTRASARVGLCARDGRELERAGENLASLGVAPALAVADVTDPSQMHRAVADIEAEVGPIDVLINNAGIIKVGPISAMTREDFEQALAVNFWGAYNSIEAVLPGMRERKEGRIVNISSIGGRLGVPHLAPYCVGKFALVGYSKALRAELAPDGIVVTTVCPGLMRTGSPRNASFKGQHDAEYAWFKLSDSLPLLTVSAEQAAGQILGAVRRGDGDLLISLPAQLAVYANAIFPELTANLVSLANRLLPGSDDSARSVRLGKECQVSLVLAPFTILTDTAAQQNNEIDPSEDCFPAK